MPSRPPRSTSVDELVKAHLPLARRIAARYCVRLRALPVLHDDIESAALYGLVQAAQRYDGHSSFVRFAGIRIKGAIGDAMREMDILSRYARARQRRDNPDAPPTMVNGAFAQQLLGVAVWTDPNQERAVSSRQLRERLTAAIRKLPERHARVLSLRYVHDVTLMEAGRVLGISDARVCQIEGQALRELRAVLARE